MCLHATRVLKEKGSPTPALQLAPCELHTLPHELSSPEDGAGEKTCGLAGPQLLPAAAQPPRMDAISATQDLRFSTDPPMLTRRGEEVAAADR